MGNYAFYVFLNAFMLHLHSQKKKETGKCEKNDIYTLFAIILSFP